jgi:hypothetical protein
VTESGQFEIILQVLQRFQSAGILDRLVLIGGWCLYLYRHGMGLKDPSALRTTDVDFLVPRPFRFEKVTDVPAILEELGFASTFHGMSGLAVYDHPELRLEFLVPEIGRGSSEPVAIRGLLVKAQGIRYLNFLSSHVITIMYHGLAVRVPEPLVFALHKLIVSSRRTKKDKREKDITTAIGVLEFLFKDPKEKERAKDILAKLPAKWRKAILSVSAKHFPVLNETYEERN